MKDRHDNMSNKLVNSFIDHLEIYSIVISIGIILGIVAILMFVFGYQFAPMYTECLASHITTHRQLNANDDITFNKPTEVCDVEAYRQGHHTYIGFQYSYEFQQKYNKTSYMIGLDCSAKPNSYVDNVTYDMNTKQFICSGGNPGKEILQ